MAGLGKCLTSHTPHHGTRQYDVMGSDKVAAAMSISTNRPDGTRGSGPADRAPSTGGTGGASSREFDAHKHTMRSFENAAKARAYDPDDLTRIYQEATDGDGEEAEALAKHGQLRGQRGSADQSLRAEQAQEPRARAPQRTEEPQDQAQESGEAKATETAGINGKVGTAAASERTSETQSLAQPSLSDRQGSLVARLVTQPDDYRGLSAANTEAAFEAAGGVQGFVGKGYWVRVTDSGGASMADQVERANGQEVIGG